MDWKFAVSSAQSAPNTEPILLKGTVAENLRSATILGYDAIEMHTRENAELNYTEIRAVSREWGCRVGVIATDRLKTETGASLVNNDLILERVASKGMIRYIDMAAELGANISLGRICGQMPTGKTRKEYIDRLGAHMNGLSNHAEKSGVRIYLKTLNRFEGTVFANADEILSFFKTYELRNCFVCLDTFTMRVEEADPARAIKKCGDKLGYIQFADSTKVYPSRSAADSGTILNALQEVGYSGYVSVAYFPWPNGNYAAKKALENLKNIIDENENQQKLPEDS